MTSRVWSTVFACAAAAVTLVLAPRAFAADDPPEVHYPPSSVRIPLIMGGLGLGGAAYSVGFAVSKQSPDVPGSGALVIPIVGPWIALGKNACLELRGFLLVVEGIVQAGGLGLIAQGLLLKTESGGGDHKDRKKAAGLLEVKHGDFRMRPMPITSGRMNGLGLTGTF